MELKCEDYYFHPNGIYQNVSTWKSSLFCFDNDVEEISTAIRIYGTQNQIDKAFDEYCNRTELILDECYTFQVEKKGSFFYNKENNKIIAKKLKQYKEAYKINKRALILNLK